jgi:hypothetical protein
MSEDMKQKILTAEGDVLSALLGEVLGETPCRHKWNPNNFCIKCGFDDRNPHNGYDPNCPIPDPILLTWDNAINWRDWAVAECGINEFLEALAEVLNQPDAPAYDVAYATIQSKHLLRASALCKIAHASR